MRQDLDLWLNIVIGFCRRKRNLLKERPCNYLRTQSRCGVFVGGSHTACQPVYRGIAFDTELTGEIRNLRKPAAHGVKNKQIAKAAVAAGCTRPPSRGAGLQSWPSWPRAVSPSPADEEGFCLV